MIFYSSQNAYFHKIILCCFVVLCTEQFQTPFMSLLKNTLIDHLSQHSRCLKIAISLLPKSWGFQEECGSCQKKMICFLSPRWGKIDRGITRDFSFIRNMFLRRIMQNSVDMKFLMIWFYKLVIEWMEQFSFHYKYFIVILWFKIEIKRVRPNDSIV